MFVNIENFTPILYDDDLTMMTQLVNRYTTILPFDLLQIQPQKSVSIEALRDNGRK